MRSLFRLAGDWFYAVLISLGWQPRDRGPRCEHPDAGEDGP